MKHPKKAVNSVVNLPIFLLYNVAVTPERRHDFRIIYRPLLMRPLQFYVGGKVKPTTKCIFCKICLSLYLYIKWNVNLSTEHFNI